MSKDKGGKNVKKEPATGARNQSQHINPARNPLETTILNRVKRNKMDKESARF